MYRIGICDSDRRFIAKLELIIINHKKDEENFEFYEYYSGKELIDVMKREHYDLLILDTILKETDSYEVAYLFRKSFPHTPLVFCSEFFMPDINAFKSLPFRYLLKSFDQETFNMEICEILNHMRKKYQMPSIVGKYYYNSICFAPDDIMYFENAKNGSLIYPKDGISGELEGKKIITGQKIDILDRRLHKYGFRIIHNRFLVNMNYVSFILSDGRLSLIDGTELKVSRTYLREIRSEFVNIIEEKQIY